jgi:hypothetical protein
MGVEYKHFLIPSDPGFIPQNEIFVKFDALLSKWNLKADNPVVYNLTEGKNEQIVQVLNTIEIGHGIAVKYPGVEGKQVSEIVGPGYYGEDTLDEERYFQEITLITGTDYRIHPSNEELYIAIKKPPVENGKQVTPYCDNDELFFGLHAEAYSCSLNAIPPEVRMPVDVHNSTIGGPNFFGYWRTALAFDFGKDLPALFDKSYKLKNSNFLKELEQAIGISLIEIGEVY